MNHANRAAKRAKLTEREIIDELAGSISELCHTVIAKRLEQFFEVIHEEIRKANRSETQKTQK